MSASPKNAQGQYTNPTYVNVLEWLANVAGVAVIDMARQLLLDVNQTFEDAIAAYKEKQANEKRLSRIEDSIDRLTTIIEKMSNNEKII